ncbi:unnamed protein product [Sphenostylis stenocarpa]|uniref:Uncharacterized protein n=1 Tax=Sphenostylis stenocarpa TaxID=92480 RepID=A0AA86VCX8_9FABA|nr:unnamed protein product [Sphenostylis stenocarpa]
MFSFDYFLLSSTLPWLSQTTPLNFALEIADNNIVYRNKIHHSVQRRAREPESVAADPTLPRTKSVRCSQCNHGEAVFFKVSDVSSSLIMQPYGQFFGLQRPKGKKAWHSLLFAATQHVATVGETRTLS